MENTESSEHILENEIDETINDAEEIESQPRAKRVKGLVYHHLCNFESFETISEEIKNRKIGHNQWIFCGLKNTQNGDKYWYDCSFSKHGCKVRMFLWIRIHFFFNFIYFQYQSTFLLYFENHIFAVH